MTNVSDSPSYSKATVKGTLWLYAAYYGGKAVVFLSTVVLARILTKDDFGVVGFVVTIISFLDIVKDLGIGSAVIYHRYDASTSSTAFWTGLVISLALAVLVWLSAPLVGEFFGDPRTVWVTRMLAFNFPLSALGNIQESLLVKELAFGKKFIPDIAKAMTKGVLSIGLAVAGFGPISLIVGHLGGTLISSLVVWKISPWKPSFDISIERSKDLLRFGLALVGVNAIGVFVLNVDYLIIGRYLGAESLGVYTLAFRIPELVILQLCAIVAQVVFPVFAKMNDDLPSLVRGYLKTTRYVALITVPLGLGIALTSKPFTLAFFSEKWLDAIPVMQAIAIYSMLLSLGFNAGDVYKAIGKPSVLIYISLVKTLVLVPGLLWAVLVPADTVSVAYVQIAVAAIGTILNLVVANRMLSVSMLDLWKPYLPAFVAGAVMCAVVWPISLLVYGINPWFQLIILPVVGGLAYAGCLFLIQRSLFMETSELMRGVFTRKF
jgi:O-antigen/teichoic acid export membrane protein